MKLGVVILRDVTSAHGLDKLNKNKIWDAAIANELSRVQESFQLLEDNEPTSVRSKKISYHITFDVKFDLYRKARLVPGEHTHKDVSTHSSYTSIVSIDSIRIIFLLDTLNDLDILTGDIGNTYLNVPCKEKVYDILQSYIFGSEHENKRAIIVRALYGIKSTGKTWR